MFKFYFNEKGKIFDKLRTTNKITHEFSVVLDEKDIFLDWVKILSRPEFLVDVDLKDLYNKEYLNGLGEKCVLFRVKVSGKKEDVDRWVSNLKQVSNFLNGNYELTYIKKRSESNAD